MTEPKILLLDEPLSALDAHLKVRMQSVLSGLQKDLGITFVYVTHSMSEAFSMADRVVIMSRGKIEQIGTPEEIYREPHTALSRTSWAPQMCFPAASSSGGNAVWKIDGENATFTVKAPAGVQKARAANLAFAVSSENMSLAAVGTPCTGNSIGATVVGGEFAGASATVFLETNQGQELKVQNGHDELKSVDLRAGQRLLVHCCRSIATFCRASE